MIKHIEIRFVDAGVAARAVLLMEEMPRTCKELLKHLPLEGTATHARYSGSEVATIISNDIRIEREKATCAVLPGDVAYVWLNRDDHYGLDSDVAEICWFYDRDARPQMFEGPVRVNVFARIVGETDKFYEMCADTRISGVKKVRISLVD
ncbi:MAG TPA: DUF3830 family protein [Planctomycetota bacterium]|nr:DUF3830 family protein [Planctomycetota bacterium]HUV38040.1 DUF3830 family protein [Planctomycetota bacterium]